MREARLHLFGREYMTIKECTEKYGIKESVIRTRIARGKTGEALIEPQVSKAEAINRARATKTWRKKEIKQ